MSGANGPSELWGVQIARLHKQGSQFLLEALKPWGLGTGLHPYLLALESGALHQEALSQALWVDKANTARAVAKLEALGLVVRRDSGEDKRLKHVELTPEGVRLLVPIKAALAAWETKLREGLSGAEVQTLARLFGARGLPVLSPLSQTSRGNFP